MAESLLREPKVDFSPRPPVRVDAGGLRFSIVAGHDEIEQPWPPPPEEISATLSLYPRLKAVRRRAVLARPKNRGPRLDRQFVRECIKLSTERRGLITFSTSGSGASRPAACHAQFWPLDEVSSGLFESRVSERLTRVFVEGDNPALPGVGAELLDFRPLIDAARFESLDFGQLAQAVVDVVEAYDHGQSVNLAIQPSGAGVVAIVIARRRDHRVRSHVTGRRQGWRVAGLEMAGILQVINDAEFSLLRGSPNVIPQLFESVALDSADRCKFQNVVSNL